MGPSPASASSDNDNPTSPESGDSVEKGNLGVSRSLATNSMQLEVSRVPSTVGTPLPQPMLLPNVMDLLLAQSNQQQLQQMNAIRRASEEQRSRDALLLSIFARSSPPNDETMHLRRQPFHQTLGFAAMHSPQSNQSPTLLNADQGAVMLSTGLASRFALDASIAFGAAVNAISYPRVASVADSLVPAVRGSFNNRSTSQSLPTTPPSEPTASSSTEALHSPVSGVDKTFPSERSSLNLQEGCSSPREAYRILKVLGCTLRSKTDPFIDVAALPEPQGPGVKRIIRGSDSFFPDQLHSMLTQVEKEGVHFGVVSFMPHGRAFRVHKKEAFIKDVLPKYFGGQGKWSSFLRQLKLYGFLRVSTGKDCNAYYHELFLRTRPELTEYMRRVGTPKGLDRRTYRLAEADDPDFYCLPPLTEEGS